MRLLRPNFSTILPNITFERDDYLYPALNNNQLISGTLLSGVNASPLSIGFQLPTSFGNVYVGENFKCYIAIHNVSDVVISKVSLKVYIRTSSNKEHVLVSGNEEIKDFGLNYYYDHIISYEINEKNNHVLICDCKYNVNGGETKSFQKFFKFNVFDPLEINSRIIPINNGYICNSEVINKTNSTIYINSANFITEPDFVSQSLNNPENMIFLKPENKWEFLFKIDHENIYKNSKELLLGKIKINWRTILGETGTFYSGEINRQQPQKKFVLISLLDIPEKLQINEMVKCTMKIVNLSKKEIKPSITIIPSSELLITGITSFISEPLQPMEEKHMNINILPIQGGIHTFPTVKVHDLISKKTNEFKGNLTFFIN